MTVRLLVGDVHARLADIPDRSVDLIACSPPFLALRKYGDDNREMGSERTPADFLDALLELTTEFRRVLTPHGSIAIELGDTYSGSGGAGGDYGEDGLRAGQPMFRQGYVRNDRPNRSPQESPKAYGNGGPRLARVGRETGWPLAKSLTLIPTLYPASLAYGYNMLNPAHTFDRWRVRNLIVWARPNPPVGALGDKVRPATSYITIACTSPRRFFDLDGVRTPMTRPEFAKYEPITNRIGPGRAEDGAKRSSRGDIEAGVPPLDWWEDDDPTGHATLILPTQPYPGAHYATWPEKLAARLIEMMCPRQVCVTCGVPSTRITEDTPEMTSAKSRFKWESGGLERGLKKDAASRVDVSGARLTTGWSDCGHNTWRPGMILDPFAGSGTTLAVAQGLGRDCTGIELYEANADLVRERVGMFLEVDGDLQSPPVLDVGDVELWDSHEDEAV